MPNSGITGHTAIWALTRGGWSQARRIAGTLTTATCHIPRALDVDAPEARRFDRFIDEFRKQFQEYAGHVGIMSTGIMVRALAPVIRHKTEDPAVVVLDEAGQFVISLLSGHIGGANALTRYLAERLGAAPVITTATDVHALPAVDEIAARLGMHIENAGAIKAVNMALIDGARPVCRDPLGLLRPHLEESPIVFWDADTGKELVTDGPGIVVDDTIAELPPDVLVLRPPTLVAGIGCNRGTSEGDIRSLLETVLARFRLSIHSLRALATVDIKRDETGLSDLARRLGLPVLYYSTAELDRVGPSIQTPSETVEKHVGVKSVCEAAAILGSHGGDLIVPKQKTPDVTVAIARNHCIL